MKARLYVIPGSHPSMAARLMLEMKGIDYKRTDLMPVIAKGVLRVVGFSGNTVPALKLDGRKIQGTMEIARALDEIVPDPPLFPADASQRAEVEQAERFGDDDLQKMARRITWASLRRNRAPLRSYSEGAKLGIPIGLAVKTGGPIVAAAARINEADDEHVRADIAALPGALSRIDDWIAAGVLGGETPNAADIQIATSLRLLTCLDDIRPAIESRPAGEMAVRFVPDFPGSAPPVLPSAWLEPLNALAAQSA